MSIVVSSRDGLGPLVLLVGTSVFDRPFIFAGPVLALFGALTFSSMAFSVHQLLVIWKCSWLELCARWRLESPVLGKVGYNLCATEGINEAKESKAVYRCWQCTMYSLACLHYELNIFTYPSDCLFVLAGAAAARVWTLICLAQCNFQPLFPLPPSANPSCMYYCFIVLLSSFSIFSRSTFPVFVLTLFQMGLTLFFCCF